jgi:cytosine/adenosine deaminase-related metal-dependent hydrolase
MWTLTARWIFPVDAPPLQRGTVTIDGERILAVEAHGQRAADVDLGDAAVLPGLVNAHTHLDLTAMRGLAPPSPDFIGWLRQVTAHRRATTPEQTQADIRAGLTEAMGFGTTLIGDITAGGASWEVLASAPVRAVVFHELLGLPFERAMEMAQQAYSWLQAHPATPSCRPALSPHAPYSTHQALYHEAAKFAGCFGVPLATHLAETAAELDLLAGHPSPFLDFLVDLGVWNPKGLASKPSEYVRACRRFTRALLLVHCNFLPARTYIPREGAVVYCPRTHAAFGHPPHPFREFLRRGVRVALGTDGLASNPDLDLLAEARFVRQKYPDVSGDVLLRMATLSGAEALGWADETGSLTPGKSADLIVLPLPPDNPHDPHDLILRSSAPVRALLWCGRWLFGA